MLIALVTSLPRAPGAGNPIHLAMAGLVVSHASARGSVLGWTRGRITDVTELRDCTDPSTWWPHVAEATKALAAGGLVVMPTDTVYGLAADAFQPEAVQSLLDAKGRGRQQPPPVLIGDLRTLDGLAADIPDAARELAQKYWPGPLTIVLQAQPSLQWDLGETHGTVALRMPKHDLTLAVLARTGPLAVSSANTTGDPAATTATHAEEMLGDTVRVYLDGGLTPGAEPSTIIDATGQTLRVLRHGVLSSAELGIAEEPVDVAEPAAPAGACDPAEDAEQAAAAPEPAGPEPEPGR